MNQLQKQANTTLVRVDKNINKSGSDFKKSFGKEAKLIFDITIYLASNYQKNLFDYETFDVADFAEKLGYSVSNLKRKIQKKELFNYKLQINDEDKLLNFDNVIENALYKATAQNLIFTKTVKNYTDNEDVRIIEGYQLISKLAKHVSKRKDSFRYTFELSEVYRTHLTKYFTIVDISYLKLLRKQNCIYLYFYLKVLEENARANQGNKTVSTPYFDILCEEAEIDIKDPAEAKKKLTKKLKHIQVSTGYNFSFKYYNRSGKHKYGVQLIFPDNKEYLTGNQKQKDDVIMHRAAEHSIRDALLKKYRSLYQQRGRLNEGKFLEWFYNSDIDKELKYELYYTLYADRRRKDLNQVRIRCRKNAQKFFARTV